MYLRDGIAASLDVAADLGQKALEAVDPADRNHPAVIECLSDVGEMYALKFQRTGDTAEIDRSIEYLRRALILIPDYEPGMPRRLFELCAAYCNRSRTTGAPITSEAVNWLAEQTKRLAEAAPMLRVRALTQTVWTAQEAQAHHIAAELASDAVATLPAVARSELTRSNQEGRLGEFTDLIADAIAAHLQIGNPQRAVELAEIGRGILLTTQLGVDTELIELRGIRADLAAEFERYHSGAEHRETEPDEVTAARGWLRSTWWNQLITEIRQVDGFDQFQATPDWTQLTQAAQGGPVILVNAGNHRADAVVIHPGTAEPQVVELDRLDHDTVQRHALTLVQASSGSPAALLKLQRVLPDILAWLWEAAVSPVLTALGHTSEAGDQQPRPRVWWTATGALSLLPLHAAGPPDGPSTLDRVVSSFAPTIRVLQHARRTPSGARRQLVVGMRQTPNCADLPGTVAEAGALATNQPDSTKLIDNDATGDNVLAALRHATWAHFACHATNQQRAPSDSHLRLSDRPVTVGEIADLRLPDAHLAYLSACSTAQTAWSNPDEAIHLASAFQVAGFRHVIGTLWPLSDDTAATAARRFYELLSSGETTADPARALHQVTIELRHKYPGQPHRWAPLIHTGP
jgi:hypothetical protein